MRELEVESTIQWKLRWKRIGNWCNGFAKITAGMSIICYFVAGFYEMREFIFAAGCTNAVGLVLMSYSNYCFSQAKEKNQELEYLVSKEKIGKKEEKKIGKKEEEKIGKKEEEKIRGSYPPIFHR